jgi:uncharacterized membrane protein
MAAAPLGNRIVTGSVVNFMLIVSVMICGLASGLSVAVVSPVMAKFLGIGPFWSLIPFIAAGNIVLVIFWHFIGNRNMGPYYAAYAAASITAAIAKFLVLYIGVVKIAVPVFLGLPEGQSAIISNMFSIPQVITALVGGILATVLLPALKKSLAGAGL